MLGWVQKNVLLVVVLAALVTTIGIESRYIVHLAGKRAELKAQLETATQTLDVTKVNLEQERMAFTTLTTAHNSCLEEIKVSKNAQGASVEYISKLESDLQTQGRKLREVRNDIYKLPGCDQLATLDIAAACPALGVSLRQRATTQAGTAP